MNYQPFSPFFTRTTTLLFFLTGTALSFFGFSALFIYFILLGFIFPIGISMRLHRLNETGEALTLTENTHWITYIHGFPAQEQRAVLRNPCFWSAERVQQFFIRCFVGKIILQASCIVILAHEYLYPKESAIPEVFALVILIYLLYAVGKSACMMYLISANKWQCEPLTTDTGSVWYQGYIPKGEGRETLFARLV